VEVGDRNSKKASQRRHQIALYDMARVIVVKIYQMRGGYTTIMKVCIEGAPGIESFWEFEAKISNQDSVMTRSSKVGAPERIDGSDNSTCRFHMICCNLCS
jgi:hypothetical protein